MTRPADTYTVETYSIPSFECGGIVNCFILGNRLQRIWSTVQGYPAVFCVVAKIEDHKMGCCERIVRNLFMLFSLNPVYLECK